MGEHNTWFDFLNALPGWPKLHHALEYYLGRGHDSAVHWTAPGLETTHFTLNHVFGLLVVGLFVIWGAASYRSWVKRQGKDAIVPQKKLGIATFFELFTEAVVGMSEGVMGKKNAERFLPLIGSLAFVIFFSNVMALIPGFVPPTDTLKTNLAMAVVVFVATHYYGVKEHGPGYIKHFFGPIWWLAPIMFVIELISHIARPVSLSLRLMANMAADHKVLVTFFTLIPLLVPVPFLVLGLLVSVVQTLVFCLLSMVYISMAVAHDH